MPVGQDWSEGRSLDLGSGLQMSIVKVVLLMEGGSQLREWTVLGPEREERSQETPEARRWLQSRETAEMREGRRRRKVGSWEGIVDAWAMGCCQYALRVLLCVVDGANVL